MTKRLHSSSNRVTLREVARRAGVAATTASSALHDTGRVSKKQRIRIQQIAEELGYRAKLAARLLRANRTNRLGLLLTTNEDLARTSESGFFGPILGQFVEVCERIGLGYHVEFLKNDHQGQYSGPEQLAGGVVDGSLVAGYIMDPDIRTWLTENQDRYPWVSLDEPAEYSVIHQTDVGIYRAAQFLAALRHRRVAYLGCDADYTVHRLGREGYQKAVQDFRLDTLGSEQALIHVKPLQPRVDTLAINMAAARRLFELEVRPTAVICQSVVAARCVIYIAMEQGLTVPGDMSIIAYGTATDAERSPPCLHCVEPDFSDMTDRAIGMLRARLAGEGIAEKSIGISPKLVERASVAPPRSED